jgi:hypothetical protein
MVRALGTVLLGMTLLVPGIGCSKDTSRPTVNNGPGKPQSIPAKAPAMKLPPKYR